MKTESGFTKMVDVIVFMFGLTVTMACVALIVALLGACIEMLRSMRL